MTNEPNASISDFLESFAGLLSTGELSEHASDVLAETQSIASQIHTTGAVPVARDPFKGRAPQAPQDPDVYYTMFWRMFDQTPAAMVQPLAIPLRRLLAQRIFKHCGEGVIFHHNVLFSKGSNISIGDHSLVNRYVMLDDRAELTIGSFVMVAAGVTIETHTHPFDDFSVPIAVGGRSGEPVSIGDNSVLGYNSVVMAGTHVGYRCIIGANSVVTKDIPDFTVAGGVPAKPIKEYRPAEGRVWVPSDGMPEGV